MALEKSHNQVVNRSQYLHLQSFFFALSCHYTKGIRTNFGHWANLLDDRGISWSIQNTVAVMAEDPENTGFYLSTLLKQHNIEVS
jgi:hypothetical protein